MIPSPRVFMNVLFILADDMGAWALGCAGNQDIQTPHLDRLAADGMRFSNAFCVSPVCSPARASLMTGKMPSQHGVLDWIRRGNSSSESEDGQLIEYLAKERCYTEILAENGYVCGLSGKWHLGNAPQPQKGHSFWHVHAKGGSLYYGAPMICEGREYLEPKYVTEAITDHALEFLHQQSREKPFYLGVHYTAPHSPWGRDQHPAEYYDRYFDHRAFESFPNRPMHSRQINSAPCGSNPEKRRTLLSGYAAAISAMDAQIGRLLAALEQRGLLGETLIVFTSDNGMNMGHHGIYGKGNGTYPPNLFDTSVKVPFLAACPEQIPAGAVCDALFSHYDFLPTLLEFLGLDAQIPPGLPGSARADLWRGTSGSGGDEVIVLDEYGPARMIRSQRYKLVWHEIGGPDEFYDLAADPEEEVNLIESATHRPLIEDLKRRLHSWFAQYTDPQTAAARRLVTGMGQLDLARENSFSQEWRYLADDSPEPR